MPTPADPNVKLQTDDGVSQPCDKGLFQRLVGSLQYLANGRRPDIAYAVNMVARFSSEPTSAHLTTAKRIFWYLKETNGLTLIYTRVKVGEVTGFSDADWAGEIEQCKSASGNIFRCCSILGKQKANLSGLIHCGGGIYGPEHGGTGSRLDMSADDGADSREATTYCAGRTIKAPSVQQRILYFPKGQNRYYFVRELVEEGIIDVCWNVSVSCVLKYS